MTDVIDWDFDEENNFEDVLAQYNAPVTKHDCSRDKMCLKTKHLMPAYHDIECIFDDFELSLRQREVMRMEIVRSRGRDNKERTLMKQFQSTSDGSHIMRMQTTTFLTTEYMGQIKFESREDLSNYYNFCVVTFGFDKDLLIDADDPDGLFSALDDDDDLFGGLDDDLFSIEDDDDLFSIDEDDLFSIDD